MGNGTLILPKAILDGTGSLPVEGPGVLVEDGRIAAIGSADELRSRAPLDSVELLELPSAYLLPGLIDSHAHLMFGVWGTSYEEVLARDSDAIMLLRATKNALVHLKAGVTTLRDNGAKDRITFDLREGAKRGYITAPRLLLSGRPVTVTGGHFYWCNQEADGVDGVRKAVRELVKDGADHIKIMASGGGTAITDNRRAYYTVEELKAIVDEAHLLGKKTTAHCLATQSIVNALDAGVDMIEHAGFIEPDGSVRFRPEIAERIARQNVIVSPTIQILFREMLELEQKVRDGILKASDKRYGFTLDRAKAVCDSRIEIVRRLWSDWQVPMISGTDAIFLFGDYALGLELMVEAGMSHMDVVRASTSVAAKAIGIDDLAGTIEVGKEADLIAVDRNPLDDITAFRQMVMVMRAGVRVV